MKEHGFAGILYSGKQSLDKTVIYVGGGGSTPDEAIRAASFIRAAGIHVLVLGYYGWEDTPQKMEGIPVEYVENAVQYLRTSFNTEKIIMAGASEGAVYSLLCASMISDINAVCAVAPMDYLMASPMGKGQVNSVYTRNGVPLPFVPFSLREQGVLKLLTGALFNKRYGLRRIIRYACDQVSPSQDDFIRIENMRATLLIIVPDFDDVWGSEEAAVRIEKRLESHDYPYPVETITLNNASHLMGGDFDLSGFRMKLFRWALLRAEHDHPRECEKARKDCMEHMLRFFEGV